MGVAAVAAEVEVEVEAEAEAAAAVVAEAEVVAAVPAVIVKFVFETSKKTLPTASIFTRAVVVAMSGIVTASRAVVRGAGREHVRIREAAVRREADLHVRGAIGGMSVFALSQVIVCVDRADT